MEWFNKQYNAVVKYFEKRVADATVKHYNPVTVFIKGIKPGYILWPTSFALMFLLNRRINKIMIMLAKKK